MLWDTLTKNTHYFNRYEKFINQYKTRNDTHHGNCEKHHIIPKSLGGKDSQENIIELSKRAHFIAHMLLWKAFPGCSSMSFAVHQMSSRNKIKSSRLYEEMKKYHSIACSKRNTGRILPQEWKDAISDGHKKYDHSHLKTEEARESARIKALTLLKSDEVIKKRQQTMRNKGEEHASKRQDVKDKISKAHQFSRIIAISPTGEEFFDILLTEFINQSKISKYVIKRYLDKGKVPPPQSAFLARWNKLRRACDEGRIIATGWEFKSLLPV